MPVYIASYSESCPAKNLFAEAIKLICSPKYATIAALEDFGNLWDGYISITFLKSDNSSHGQEVFQDIKYSKYYDRSLDEISLKPSTSKEALEKEKRRQLQRCTRKSTNITKYRVLRDFRADPLEVEMQINDGKNVKMNIYEFHANFLTTAEYVSMRLFTFGSKNSNWLRSLVVELNSRWNFDPSVGTLFEKYMYLYEDPNMGDRQLFTKLTVAILTSLKFSNIVQTAELIDIFNTTSNIFEFLTNSKFSVWFLIPYQNNLIHLGVALENLVDFKFQDADICIQKKSGNRMEMYDWKKAEHGLQDLFLIAFQMAIAHTCGQTILYFQNMEAITRMQLIRYAIDLIIDNGQPNMNTDKASYIDRIIMSAVSLNLTAIIEVSGGISTQIKEINMIQYFNVYGTDIWTMNSTTSQ
ncbi:protein ORD [Teleopsis dalmanni]|uniref:protein ORD n=1 Tax=Teleopsis dalmanni TaxID=139649 RepID=UPI0018CF0A86|nr:protein ORD [Teleopsis dalmanni]